jgi:hypothetical protein
MRTVLASLARGGRRVIAWLFSCSTDSPGKNTVGVADLEQLARQLLHF